MLNIFSGRSNADAILAALDRSLVIMRMAGQVDTFVMAATQGLCVIEKENAPLMEQPANRERKARILAGLGEIDEMMGKLRRSIADMRSVEVPRS